MGLDPSFTDIDTLLFVSQLVATLMAALTVMGAWQARERSGPGLIAAAYLAYSAGQWLRLGLADYIDYPEELVPGHVGGLIFSALLLLGVRAFTGQRLHARRLAIVTVGLALGALALASQATNGWPSLALTAAGSAVMKAVALNVATQRLGHRSDLPAVVMLIALAIGTTLDLARLIWIAPLGADDDAELAVSANGLAILCYIGYLILQGFAVLLMVNESLQSELRDLANIDALTGLLNRHGLTARLRLDGASPPAATTPPMALAMIDIDHFKAINDRYGHPVGDAVLRHVGRIVSSSVRTCDLAARLGGEEFLLVWRANSAADARDRADRIRRSIEASPLRIGDHVVRATSSIGVAYAQTGDESFESLLRLADQALYRAKRLGRNRVEEAGVRPDLLAT